MTRDAKKAIAKLYRAVPVQVRKRAPPVMKARLPRENRESHGINTTDFFGGGAMWFLFAV